MYRRDKLMEKLVAEATVEQRGVLGFHPRAQLLDAGNTACCGGQIPCFWY